MTLAAEQAKAAKRLVWLLELELTYRIEGKTWTQASSPNTNAWWMDHSTEDEPSRVFQLLRPTHVISELDEEASAADCHANAGSWYYDSSNGRLYVHMSGSDAPDTSGKYYLRSHFWKRFSTVQYPDPYTLYGPDGLYIEPRLGAVPGELAQEVNDFTEVGVRETWGGVEIMNPDGRYDAALTTYIWQMCRFILKVGARGDAYANLTTIHRGRTGGYKWDDESIHLAIEDPVLAED